MELEYLKSKWIEVSEQLEQQKELTGEMILKMAKQQSKSIFAPILHFETLGIVVSSGMLIYLYLNAQKLNDWLSIAGAITTAIILITGLVMSAILIKRIREVDVVKNTYRQTLVSLNRLKKHQYRIKWISAFLAPFLALSLLPALAATWFDKSLLNDWEEYRESLIPALLLIPVIWYFIGRFYAKRMNELDELLEDLQP